MSKEKNTRSDNDISLESLDLSGKAKSNNPLTAAEKAESFDKLIEAGTKGKNGINEFLDRVPQGQIAIGNRKITLENYLQLVQDEVTDKEFRNEHHTGIDGLLHTDKFSQLIAAIPVPERYVIDLNKRERILNAAKNFVTFAIAFSVSLMSLFALAPFLTVPIVASISGGIGIGWAGIINIVERRKIHKDVYDHTLKKLEVMILEKTITINITKIGQSLEELKKLLSKLNKHDQAYQNYVIKNLMTEKSVLEKKLRILQKAQNEPVANPGYWHYVTNNKSEIFQKTIPQIMPAFGFIFVHSTIATLLMPTALAGLAALLLSPWAIPIVLGAILIGAGLLFSINSYSAYRTTQRDSNNQKQDQDLKQSANVEKQLTVLNTKVLHTKELVSKLSEKPKEVAQLVEKKRSPHVRKRATQDSKLAPNQGMFSGKRKRGENLFNQNCKKLRKK